MTESKAIKLPLSNAPRRARSRDDDDDDEMDDKRAAQDAKQLTLVTAFDATGDYIFSATTKGWLNVISTATQETIHSTRLTKNLISFVRVSASGRQLLVNSRDRILRTIHVPVLSEDTPIEEISLEVEHKFQDVVNRLLWNHCAFSPTGEYICASTYKDHDVYVWERTKGSLVKILEGPKEELGMVEV